MRVQDLGFRVEGVFSGERVEGLGLLGLRGLLGGSWVVISRAIGMVTIHITLFRVHITLLLPTHEPPSRAEGLGCRSGGFGAIIFATHETSIMGAA